MSVTEISEVRRIRHEISEECDHDVLKVIAYYRRMEEELRSSGHYHFEETPEEAIESEDH